MSAKKSYKPSLNRKAPSPTPVGRRLSVPQQAVREALHQRVTVELQDHTTFRGDLVGVENGNYRLGGNRPVLRRAPDGERSVVRTVCVRGENVRLIQLSANVSSSPFLGAKRLARQLGLKRKMAEQRLFAASKGANTSDDAAPQAKRTKSSDLMKKLVKR